ncbi:hypothetical protein RR48_08754 [Papilio machaon]|uniref:Uncharacterized protein n=1 Tax=Papilio machaon TaxID=76193 RepID=A0A194RHF8_PAPMA|nr:hypothetical protein RR48_08754 [Papilio machaon]
MKLIFLFVALAYSNISQGAVDVEKTVKQVENILKTNSLLPRLTRDEILQLLNDLRDEDAKNTIPLSKMENEESKNQESTTQTQLLNIKTTLQPTEVTSTVESTTKSGSTKLAVVLPYTPRDGSSLQELYTRPPRVEIVPESKVTNRPPTTPKSKENAKSNNNMNEIFKQDFPAELQAFLNAHGLEGKPGQDNFLLPLDGFKPLPPPAKVVDGSIELPESILLAYDLISPSDSKSTSTKTSVGSQTNFLYDPLPPQYPFELDTSSSENKETIFPYDMPKPRKPKAVTSTPNYEPIDYDSVKVIPLNKGPSPIDDEKIIFNLEQNKRQTNESTNKEDFTNDTITTEVPTTVASELKDAVPAADNDQGASIADLEDSFGGAAPEVPGDSVLPPPRKNGFYWMLDWNSFLEVGDGDSKVNIRFEPKLGDPQMFLPVNVP